MTQQSQQQLQDRVIALAGVLQAAQLVDNLAMTGQCDDDKMYSALNSLFVFQCDTVKDIYGGIHRLSSIFPILKRLFQNRPLKKDRYLIHYFVQLIQLAHSLQKDHTRQDELQVALQRINQQITHLTLSHPCVYESISNAYEKNISPLSPRIQVMGQSVFIHQKDILHRIRSLLLAGIRSAILWQQMGGKRWHFLFARKSIVRTIIAMEKEKTLHGCTS